MKAILSIALSGAVAPVRAQSDRRGMKRLLLALLCIGSLLPLSVFSQDRKSGMQEALARSPKGFRMVSRLDELSPLWWGRSELECRDSARLEVVYDLKYRRESGTGDHLEMLAVLQVGSAWRKYYGMAMQFADDIQRDVSGVARGIAPVPGAGYQHRYTEEELRTKQIAGKDFLNCEIWVELPAGRLIERAHAFDRQDRSIEYEEPVPAIEWLLTGTADTVAGYRCFLATARFRGREWRAWFAPEIPVGAGPWKLNGLPGLVLKAEDGEGDFLWTCRSVAPERRPIVYYKVERSPMTRERWRRYFRQVHEDPVTMLGAGGDYLFFHKGALIGEHDGWGLPYNPLERE